MKHSIKLKNMIFEHNGLICCTIAIDLEELSLIKSNLLESAGILSGMDENASLGGIIDVLKALEFTDDQYSDIQRALKASKCDLLFESET